MRKLVLLSALLAGACSMNPKLERPPLAVASTFPTAGPAEPASAAALDWRDMFGDLRLQRLIAAALENNRDLRIATLNVEAARAQFRVQRASQLPAIEATGGYTRQRVPSGVAAAGVGGGGQSPSDPARPSGFEFGQFAAGLNLTRFEIDLFGRQRSLSQAAFERYLATGEGRRAAQIALIGAVADAYLNERLAQEQKHLTERTLADWQVSLDLTRKLRAARQNSGLEVVEAEGLVRQAEANLALQDRVLRQASNALGLLLGGPAPADLPAPLSLRQQPIRTQLPAGLPSDLLVNRPDIRQAEHELTAANADIGAARAAFFPRLSLTAAFGFSSLAFETLFQGGSRNWSFSPQIAQPIFQGGQLRGELRLAEIRKSIAIAQYERAIQMAFREVADGLAGRATFAGQVAAQREAAEAAERRVRLSNLRYRAGVNSRLELLDAQRSAYAAEQTLLGVLRDELSSAAALYRALGGGTAAPKDRP